MPAATTPPIPDPSREEVALPSDVRHALLAQEAVSALSQNPSAQEAEQIARAKAKLRQALGAERPLRLTSAADEGRWRAMLPGVMRKTLTRQGDDVSVLLKMEAGSMLPGHWHLADEHCVVISGRLRLAGTDVVIEAGGFHWVAQHTQHEAIVAEEDSLVYLRGALDVH